MMNHFRKFVLVTMLCGGACLSAMAQSPTQGAIVGTVTDDSDAAIPNARVVIHNDATNADQVLTTDASGLFRAPQLNPGTYTVTITQQGFSERRENGVVVQVSNVTSLTPHLKTGDVSQTVEVTADVPVLKFDSPDFGGHLSNTEIENIPINNRRWSSLALVTPGVTNDASGFGLISFRATSSILNNVQIDGTDDNQAFFGEERGRTRAGYSTSQVAVREFQVLTGVYSAEYGRAVGGVVNSVTKSGGNQLHGEIYYYRRDDFLSSINPKVALTNFDPATGTTTTIPYRPKDKRNQYGFGVGGPIIKDKLFWFYAWDQFRRNFPGTAVANNPGTFYATPSATVAGQLATALGVTSTVAAQRYNSALADLATDLGSVPRFGNQDINTPKLDWQITPKHHASFLYHRLRWDSPGGVQTQASNGYARDSFGTDFVKLDYGVAKLDSLINDHLTNTIRYMYGRELNDEGQQPYTDYTVNHLTGATGIVPAIALNTSNGFYAGSQYYSYRTSYPDERKWQIGDTASYIFRKHNIRFGVDVMHSYDVFDNLYQSNGSYFYGTIANYIADILKPSGACSASTGSTPTIGGGSLGCYSNIAQGFGRSKFDLATNDYAFFVQDDWKLTPTLTLNLGARYDYEQLPSPYSFAATAPQTLNHPSDKNNIAPRIGFAYDPFGKGKTVVRGGFGLYYGRNPNGLLLNTYVTTGSAAAQSSVTYYNNTLDSNGNTIKLPNVLAIAPNVAAAPSNIAYLDKNLQNPYSEQFDLTIQQDLGMGHVLSVAYLGSMGRELPNFINTNLDPTKTYTQTYTVAAVNGSCGYLACGTTLTNKVYANRYLTSTSGATAYNTLNKNFNAISGVVSNINSSYNALSVDITNRNSRRISYDVNYTWAHALDFNQTSVTAPTANNWFDPYGNQRANYSNSSLNIRHRVVGWAILNIPGLSGQSLLNYVTNGWSLKPLVQVQSGLPYSVSVSNSGGNQCAQINCLVPYSSGLGGTGVSYIPQVGRNNLYAPRNIVFDARLQKDFKLHEKYDLQLIAEGFNLANHQNITGINSTAYTLSGTVLTPQTNFGTPSSSGVNSNYAYQVRQFQFGARIMF
ncbi:MAG: carboxypeptidase regulatory-like domain-containing protein [Edaphobacter sp.]|uniref:TonB-dependent receptor n=1 Tax=Edaphobacter sp. TaxID=1934404 RepID=UPI00238B2697|nr:carboxypeptidase regulatory-like domain-containing protein [Edaphobacter sp.]MDE1176743.1 carboxypeptidase regulatory-like domain-containing protein [Edaphobacter sp.]